MRGVVNEIGRRSGSCQRMEIRRRQRRRTSNCVYTQLCYNIHHCRRYHSYACQAIAFRCCADWASVFRLNFQRTRCAKRFICFICNATKSHSQVNILLWILKRSSSCLNMSGSFERYRFQIDCLRSMIEPTVKFHQEKGKTNKIGKRTLRVYEKTIYDFS